MKIKMNYFINNAIAFSVSQFLAVAESESTETPQSKVKSKTDIRLPIVLAV